MLRVILQIGKEAVLVNVHPGKTIPLYHAFLLRLWREHPQAPWRLALQHSHEAEPVGFADLESLTGFLHYLMQPEPPTDNATKADSG